VFRFPEILRIRAFRDLWLGQAISQLGDAFYYVAFMFMVKKVTGSDAWVGAVGALETIPFLLFGPYAGVLADRIDRRKIMLASDLVSGSVLVLFGVSILLRGAPAPWLLLVVPFVLSSVRVFFMPAKSAAIPAIVPSVDLLKANAFSMTTQNMMPMVGLSLSAGVLAGLYSLSPTVFYTTTVSLNALSFLGSAVYIARLPVVMPERDAAKPTHVLEDLKDGFRYMRSRHDLLVFTGLLAVFRLSVAPFFVVFLAANEQWFDGRPQTVTWLEFTFFMGMVIGGPISARITALRPARWFCSGLAVVGLTVAAMSFSQNIWLFIFFNTIAGIAVPIADVPMTTYLQRSVPDAFRGRTNAVRDMIATGVMPIGMILAGAMLSKVGLVVAFLVMGSGMTAACLYGLIDRRFADVMMPSDLADEPGSIAKKDEKIFVTV